MKYLPHFIILLSFFFSCKEDKQKVPSAIPPPVSTETTALFFKNEKKIEIWSSATSKQLLETLEDVKLFEIGIGVHSKESKDFLRSNNYIVNRSKYKPSKIIAFPNDSRSTGQLEPCFACPHSSAEIYAKIELLLKDYPLSALY